MGVGTRVGDAVFVVCWAKLEGCGKLTMKRFFFFFFLDMKNVLNRAY